MPTRIEDVDRLLTASPLKTAVLWLTGSDADFQRVVVDAEPAVLAHPAVQFHLGLRLLSERSYAAAVGPLGRAEQLPALRSAAFRYRVYALCLSGQVEEARRLANERRDEILGEARLASPLTARRRMVCRPSGAGCRRGSGSYRCPRAARPRGLAISLEFRRFPLLLSHLPLRSSKADG